MRYAIEMTDGSVAVMQVVGDAVPEKEIERWPEKERTRVVSVTPIDEADIPTDRVFRNAWKLNGTTIDHDMQKAARIQLARIRRARNAELSALDTETIIALGKGDHAAVAEIEAQKQTLRDVPQTYAEEISAAKTIDDLKAIWPDDLT